MLFLGGHMKRNCTITGFLAIFLLLGMSACSEDDSVSQFVYAAGGAGGDFCYAVAVDGSDNMYLTGYFSETVDFDRGGEIDSHTATGSYDGFLTKINADGSYGWTKTMGGTSDDDCRGNGIIMDFSGNTYLMGYFKGTVDFDPGSGTDNHTSAGMNDIFLTKFTASGIYAGTIVIGGGSDDYGSGITIDDSGNIYLTGYFYDTVDFDPGSGTDSHTAAGSYDIFLTKINADGSYGWTKTMGGTEDDRAYGLAADSDGNIYITGYFADTVDFDPGSGADSHTSTGGLDIFVTKINADGSYGWTKTMGGTAGDAAHGIAVDSIGNIYITGYSYSSTADFDPGVFTDNHASAGPCDIFLTKISADGSYGWTKTFGGTDNEQANGLALDSTGNIYITGYFADTVDFDPGSGTDSHTSAGWNDTFVTKINSDGSYGWTKTIGGTSGDYGKGITTDSSGNAIIAGYTSSSEVEFGTESYTSAGGYDFFLYKIME